MAKVSLINESGQTLTLFLDPETGATGTPDANGYSMSGVNGKYLTGSIPETLVGEFYAYAKDSDGFLAYAGLVRLADDSNTYRCYDPYDPNILTSINDISTTASVIIPATSVPAYNGTNINIYKGVTWDINISGVGSNADDFYFTIKDIDSHTDAQAILQINTSGIHYLNGTYVPNTSGQTSYSSGNSGTVNISVQPTITSQIAGGEKYVWDIKSINTTNIVAFGHINVREDITDRFL